MGSRICDSLPWRFRERGQKRARIVYGEPLPSLLNVSPGGELITKDGEGDSHGGRGNRFSWTSQLCARIVACRIIACRPWRRCVRSPCVPPADVSQAVARKAEKSLKKHAARRNYKVLQCSDRSLASTSLTNVSWGTPLVYSQTRL